MNAEHYAEASNPLVILKRMSIDVSAELQGDFLFFVKVFIA
jgi:hypothetical protein